MTTQSILLLVLVAVLGVIFFYVIHKLNIKDTWRRWFRDAVFAIVLGFLAYDFFMKEKYTWFIFLGMGIAVWIAMIVNDRKGKSE